MYIDSNTFWWGIVIISIIIIYLFGEIRSLKTKTIIMEGTREKDREKIDNAYRLSTNNNVHIREMQTILEYLHPDFEKIKYSAHKEQSKNWKKQSILAWCKNKKLNKTETQKALKKYLGEWEKEYDKKEKNDNEDES